MFAARSIMRLDVRSTIRYGSTYARPSIFHGSVWRSQIQTLRILPRPYSTVAPHLSLGTVTYARSARPTCSVLSRHAAGLRKIQAQNPLLDSSPNGLLSTLAYALASLTHGTNAFISITCTWTLSALMHWISDARHLFAHQHQPQNDMTVRQVGREGVESREFTSASWDMEAARQAALQRLDALLPSRMVAT